MGLGAVEQGGGAHRGAEGASSGLGQSRKGLPQCSGGLKGSSSATKVGAQAEEARRASEGCEDCQDAVTSQYGRPAGVVEDAETTAWSAELCGALLTQHFSESTPSVCSRPADKPLTQAGVNIASSKLPGRQQLNWSGSFHSAHHRPLLATGSLQASECGNQRERTLKPADHSCLAGVCSVCALQQCPSPCPLGTWVLVLHPGRIRSHDGIKRVQTGEDSATDSGCCASGSASWAIWPTLSNSALNVSGKKECCLETLAGSY
ncbi:uncharacterized protein [Symphalangus syndactylus]|uniref:uncharacterized protein n=1 Tax=Symphalangus syndactylus TaxID=9590 RepID=UPI003005AE40